MAVQIGEDVKFVLPDGPRAGQVRGAKITQVISDTVLNLMVFVDGPADYPDAGSGVLPSGHLSVRPLWFTNVQRNDKVTNGKYVPGTWHF